MAGGLEYFEFKRTRITNVSFILSFKNPIQTPYLCFSILQLVSEPDYECKHLTMSAKDPRKKNNMVGPSQIINNDNHDEKDRISGKPPIFDGENFDY